ncbi:MAG: glycine cleavage system protein GcvH [Synergistaceae bacterium]|nr:glycine cleavage system protein GcvH [Synergistaceae bacterium]
MNFPEELHYTKSHEWIRDLGGAVVQVGITDHAQDQLGDLVFVNLPEVGAEVVVGGTVADVESVKAVSDIYSPVTGRIRAVNDTLRNAPEVINSDPFGAWIFEVENVTENDEYLSAADYEAFCESES